LVSFCRGARSRKIASYCGKRRGGRGYFGTTEGVMGKEGKWGRSFLKKLKQEKESQKRAGWLPRELKDGRTNKKIDKGRRCLVGKVKTIASNRGQKRRTYPQMKREKGSRIEDRSEEGRTGRRLGTRVGGKEESHRACPRSSYRYSRFIAGREGGGQGTLVEGHVRGRGNGWRNAKDKFSQFQV